MPKVTLPEPPEGTAWFWTSSMVGPHLTLKRQEKFLWFKVWVKIGSWPEDCSWHLNEYMEPQRAVDYAAEVCLDNYRKAMAPRPKTYNHSNLHT